MSSTSSQASAVSLSDSSEPGCEQSRSASASHTPEPCSQSTGPMSPAMTTCEPSPPNDSEQMELLSMLSAEDSLARTSALQERAQGLPASVRGCGESTPVLLASFDRSTSSWRTSQLCLVEGLQRFSETWPRSGLMRSGTAYQLPPLAPLTDATEFGLLPTPSATSYGSNQGGAAGRVGPIRYSLESMARKNMWPTPTARDHFPPHKPEYIAKKKAEGHGMRNLNDEVGGHLNPTWIEWLMGFPLGHTDLGAWEMPSSRKSRKSSGAQS